MACLYTLLITNTTNISTLCLQISDIIYRLENVVITMYAPLLIIFFIDRAVAMHAHHSDFYQIKTASDIYTQQPKKQHKIPDDDIMEKEPPPRCKSESNKYYYYEIADNNLQYCNKVAQYLQNTATNPLTYDNDFLLNDCELLQNTESSQGDNYKSLPFQ